MATTQIASPRLLCPIPPYANTPGNIATVARRKWTEAPHTYGEPHTIRVNPARLQAPVEVGGVRIVPDAKIEMGKMRIE